MLTIKLVLTAIAIAIGLVYVIGIAYSALKQPRSMKFVYWLSVVWMAAGEVFYIRYFIELLEAKQ